MTIKLNILGRDDTGRNERLKRLGIMEESMGYVDGANLYDYVQGTPVSATDPLGLKKETYRNVFLIEKIVDVKLLKNQVIITVRGSRWDVEGDVVNDECANPTKTIRKAEKDADNVRELFASRGKNVTEENVRRFVEEAVLPELPAWWFGGPQRVLAAAGPNSFYPIGQETERFNWTPGTILKPKRQDAPTKQKTR